MDRIHSEIRFHDRQASERSGSFQKPHSLFLHDDEYLDHETWIRPALAKFGDLTGKRALDFGCGHGMAAVVLARRGARVTAFDLSHGYLEEARRRADANGVSIDFVQANGEYLPFANGSFDAIWGNAILHHLDMGQASRELARVLAPGGMAVFCEPWGENPLLRWARRWLPYPGKERTPDEMPLTESDVDVLRGVFPDLELVGVQLLSMASRLVGPGRITDSLAACDRSLLKRVPALHRYCRYAVLTLKMPSSSV